jgi:hypothetical protein
MAPKFQTLLRLLDVGCGLPARLCYRDAFFRREQSYQNVAFHARHRFDLALVGNFDQQAVHLGAAYFLVRHFAATMENHGANFVAVAEKADDLVFANLIIMLRSGGTKFYFLELRTTAALALFVRFFVGLVKIFAVIGNLANWRVRRGRNFHQIKTALARQLHRLEWLHDAKLAALFINHPDLASANPLVDADAIALPEAAFCDIPP